jgi:hypothetical protein
MTVCLVYKTMLERANKAAAYSKHTKCFPATFTNSGSVDFPVVIMMVPSNHNNSSIERKK